jgi:CheY-like chemotaxis protein
MKTVLIIDDNPVITSIYRGKLAAEGVHTEIAADGEQGLLMLDRCKPDVVLLDLMLPKVNGMDVLKQIRARPGCRRLPVIVFSNSYSTDVMQQAWEFGATDVLHKSSTTPRSVVLALVDAIAASATAGAQDIPPATTAEPPAGSAERMLALLEGLSSGDIESAGADFARAFGADGTSADCSPAMIKLLTALDVLVATALEAPAGPEREAVHASIRALSRVARTMAPQKVAC